MQAEDSHASKIHEGTSELPIIHLSSHNHTSFKKNKDQTRILDIEFERNPHWSKQKMRELGDMLGLKDSQIYKWHWDRSQTVEKGFQKSLKKINNASKKIDGSQAKETF